MLSRVGLFDAARQPVAGNTYADDGTATAPVMLFPANVNGQIVG